LDNELEQFITLVYETVFEYTFRTLVCTNLRVSGFLENRRALQPEGGILIRLLAIEPIVVISGIKESI
jgi:hypothetical protein